MFHVKIYEKSLARERDRYTKSEICLEILSIKALYKN
jgi:hypothetical protein